MKLKYISWLPAFVIMIMIFVFSSKPADDSNKGSLTLANTVLTTYETVTNQHYEPRKRSKLIDSINFIVRKGAHFSEYALLSCAIALHFLAMGKEGVRLWLIPTALSALYASTDEYHQTFISGRSGQFRDVLIDSAGAATGAFVFLFIITLFFHIQKRREKLH